MRTRQPTIKDVAGAAGVSITTVSYVLNDRGSVSPATRERVRACARALHYHPNAFIRSLQQGKSNLIGLQLWRDGLDSERFLAAELLRGITEALASTGRDLLLLPYRPTRVDRPLDTPFLDKRVDGIIWMPSTGTEVVLNALAAATLPIVSVLNRLAPEGVGSVHVDIASGARAAVEHLIALGHRRIAVSGSLLHREHRERFAGYQLAKASASLNREPSLEMVQADAVPSPAEVLRRVRNAGTTAILCLSDTHAISLHQAAQRDGMRIPEELSIVGFDDDPATRMVLPRLSTVRVPVAKVGTEAVRQLQQLIAGHPAVRLPVLAELLVRGTTGPAPVTGLRPS
jgi:LacI family transcriptional regulator